jgi:hypothetical protein
MNAVDPKEKGPWTRGEKLKFWAIAAPSILGLLTLIWGAWYQTHGKPGPTTSNARTGQGPAPPPQATPPAKPADQKSEVSKHRPHKTATPPITATQNGVDSQQGVASGTDIQQAITGAGGVTQIMKDSPGAMQAGRDLTVLGKPAPPPRIILGSHFQAAVDALNN